MRIAYILAEFPSLSETFILREILALQRRGVEVSVFALRPGPSDRVHAEAAALISEVDYRPVWTDPRNRQAWAYWWARQPGPLLRMVGRIVRGTWRQPDLLASRLRNVPTGAYWAQRIAALEIPHIHAHWAFLPTLVAWLAAELTNRPFSFTAHAWDIFGETSLLREKIAHAAWVTTCSEFNRRHLERHYPDVAPGKVWVTYHGLDFRAEAEDPEPSILSPRSSPPVLLSIGRLQAKKGFPVLLEACALLRQRGRAFRCIIVGEGPERDRLQQLAREQCLTETVTFVGARTQEELKPLWDAAEVFTLPCVVTPEGDRDGLPNVLLEALARGLPVVTTPVSAIPEVIIDGVTGLLAPPGDAGALAQALERVLVDVDLRRRLGHQGSRRVRQQFDVDRNIGPLVRRFAETARAPESATPNGI